MKQRQKKGQEKKYHPSPTDSKASACVDRSCLCVADVLFLLSEGEGDYMRT